VNEQYLKNNHHHGQRQVCPDCRVFQESARRKFDPKSSPKQVNKDLGTPDAVTAAIFSARPFQFLALSASNRRKLLSIKHFLHPAFYSAVSPPSLAAAL
jgi:hypothetical protein